MLTLYVYKFKVDHVYDGDTIIGILDRGHGNKSDVSIRLDGINAPELNDPHPDVREAAKASKAFLDTLVKPGDILIVKSQYWDKYAGRVDGTIYRTLDDAQHSINDLMVQAGHAVYHKY
jgi:endonuclease YncB( thermonuclease family)